MTRVTQCPRCGSPVVRGFDGPECFICGWCWHPQALPYVMDPAFTPAERERRERRPYGSRAWRDQHAARSE